MFSSSEILPAAESTGFKAEMVEKVLHLPRLSVDIDSTILTADTALQQRIQSQPLLEWKALNVRRHKELS